jgi:hypothetical protein
MFGDSFSTPNVRVDPCDSFWGLVATNANIPVINNCSRACNSLDSICQLLIGMQADFDWTRDLILIGVPPLERITVFDDFKDTEYIGHRFNTQTWTLEKFGIECHRGLVSLQNYGTDKELIIHHDRSWLETQALRTIFLITTWLDSKNANYMMINLSKDFDKNNVWGPSNFLLSYCLNHSRCILFENTYNGINLNKNLPADFDIYGWNGHHGPKGNQYFFEKSLWPQLQHCNLV